MDKYVSAKGKIYTAALAGILLLMMLASVLTAIFTSGTFRIVLLAFYVIVIGCIIWIYTGTYYIFGETELLCRCGPFAEKIPYQKIRRATKCRGYLFSMALSELRIELKYGRADTDATFISPVDEDQFLEALAERCPKLEVYEA